MKNQYLKDTKKKIERYDLMKDQIELRKKDIEFYKMQLEVLQEYQDKEDVIKKITKLKIELNMLEKEVYAIDKGLKRLGPIAYKIIELKYLKRETWVSIAFETGYGQTRCKQLGKEALMIIGEYLYGLIIHQDLPLIRGARCY